ncbi:hypothetical protein GCM10023089_33880 [Quisquiliibacterium transsilvanicum]
MYLTEQQNPHAGFRSGEASGPRAKTGEHDEEDDWNHCLGRGRHGVGRLRHRSHRAGPAGAGERVWRAYLSTQATGLADPGFVNARDRIGPGPWRNAMGVLVANSVEDLHSPSSNLTKDTALDERGRPVKGRTDQPMEHDILTGSRPDGTAFPGAPFADMSCGNWTKSGPDGSAMTGHHDRAGPIAASWATSWNSSHPTRGCHPEGLRSTGGAGLFYCFAVK